jgi:phosphate transport system substrate-binding protein
LKESIRIKDQMGIMDVVSRDINAIGYGPESYRNPLVRMVPLVGLKSEQAYLPTLENIQTGRYALARALYFYVNPTPGQPLAPAVSAFLEFVLSTKGQELAKGYGSAPLTPEIAATELARLR